jgi:hypothetical protein
MEAQLEKNLSEYAFQRDQVEFNLGDTLDIKTGLILAALTFLAIQSGELLKPGITLFAALLLMGAGIAIALGGVFVFYVLTPRDYDREEPPLAYIAWAEELKSKGDEDTTIAKTITTRRLNLVNERVATNLAINIKKAKAMNIAFWCTVTAFTFNLITLFLVMHLS